MLYLKANGFRVKPGMTEEVYETFINKCLGKL
jgi:hypothetical protein